MEEEKRDLKSLILPKDTLPEWWNDEIQMGYMCAPIRDKNVQPDYESKMRFWSEMIHIWCNHFKVSSFTLEDLNAVFKWNGNEPTCLTLVIDEMDKIGLLTNLTEFLEPPPPESWTLWSLDLFLRKPLVWTYNKVKDTIYNSETNNDLKSIYVYNGIVEEQAKILEESIKDENKDKILTLDDITRLTGLKDIKLALHFLYKQRKIDLQTNSDKVLVKFYSGYKKFISPIDLGIYTLKNNVKALKTNIDNLESKKEKLTNEAKSFLEKGSRQLAKNCLRKKITIDRCIEKRLIALENIHSLLDTIRDAETDAMIIEAYQNGVDALRKAFDEAGLTEENASTTMDNVKEAIGKADEISQEITSPIPEGTDAECEAELDILMMDIETKANSSLDENKETLINKFEELSFDMPSPSRDFPSSSSQEPSKRKIKI